MTRIETSLLTFFFLTFAVLLFIPIRRLPLLPFAPINVIVYPFLLYAALIGNRIVRALSPALIFLLLSFFGFVLLDAALSYLKNAEGIKVFGQIRIAIFALIIFAYARSVRYYGFVFKTVLFLILFSTLVGMLIYLFGEPYQSFRMWILGAVEGTEERYLQVAGSRIAGLSASIFAFSYHIAPALVMSFGLYVKERKLLWLSIFSIFVLGLILNGERSSALMAFLALLSMLFLHYRKSFRLFLGLVLVISLVVGTAKYTLLRPYERLSQNQTLLHRLNLEQQGGFNGRYLQGAAGILTIIKNPLTGGTAKQYQKEVHQLFRWYGGSIVPESIEIPAPHNHYINIGMHAGIAGMLLLLIFMYCLFRTMVKFRSNCDQNPKFKDYYYITTYTLLASLGNAVFHNHGIFFAETASWALVGLMGAGSAMILPSSLEKQDA